MAYKRYRRLPGKTLRFGKKFKYGRRWYRRRSRISHYRRARGLRRFPKATEAKMVEFQSQNSWLFNTEIATDNVSFSPGLVAILPHTTAGSSIGQGTGINQRIGAKVKPIKFRLCGVLSYDRKFSQTSPIIPESFHIRLLVYQVRGGNGDKSPSTNDYHPLAMATDTGLVGGKQLQRVFNYYQCTDASDTTFSPEQMRMNMGTGKTPLRLGIGGQFKMLYTKTFVLSSSSSSTKPFRIVTKVPNRLVWAEAANGSAQQQNQSFCRNCIYALWVVVPQTPNPIGNIYLSCNYQLFYIDK